MNRREFIGFGAMAGAGALTRPARAEGAAPAAPQSATSKSGTVKFCVFADIHYKPGPYGFPHSTKEWLGRILERAEREHCDFVIHCGDMSHNPKADKDYVDYYNSFRIPTYHTVGNHETNGCTYEEMLEAYKLERGYYHFDFNGFRFIVVDTNYYVRSDGSAFTFGDPTHEKLKGDRWGVLPAEELAWLKKAIDESPYPCVTFSHLSFERAAGKKAVRDIFAAANAKTPGKVRLSINGHYHTDFFRILDQVAYLDMNSASYQWIGSKSAHGKYPDEFFKSQNLKPRKVPYLAYDDPLCAVLTLTADGGMKIDGMRSTFACGVTPAQCNHVLDYHSRETTPFVQSVDLKFRYRA